MTEAALEQDPRAAAARPPSVLANWIDPEPLAAQLGVTTETLRRWRRQRQGPPFSKVGRAVRYFVPGIEPWLRGFEQKPERSRPRTMAEHRIRP